MGAFSDGGWVASSVTKTVRGVSNQFHKVDGLMCNFFVSLTFVSLIPFSIFSNSELLHDFRQNAKTCKNF